MRLRRWVLASLVTLGVVVSCAPGFDPPSSVTGLRVLGVDLDTPYAAPGATVTFRMTVTDGLRDEEGNPRPLQLAWIGGCFNPQGDQYVLCLPQLADVFAGGFGSGTSSLVKLATAAPEDDGEPSAHSFTLELPADLISSRPAPTEGPRYGVGYVFFAACAGTLAPADFSVSTKTPEFPLLCLDADGSPQGAESFVPGYAQVYAFADGRTNDNPPVAALTLDGMELPSDPALAPTVPRCAVTEDERRKAGCAKKDLLETCKEHALDATIPDAAEPLDETGSEIGGALREAVWVNYYADGGELDGAVRLVSDSSKGYLPEHNATWLAPSQPGLVSVWAFARDQRGGQTPIRGYVRVE